MDTLPDELLLAIFSHLPSQRTLSHLSRVCHRLHRLCLPLLAAHITHGPATSTKSLALFFLRHPDLRPLVRSLTVTSSLWIPKATHVDACLQRAAQNPRGDDTARDKNTKPDRKCIYTLPPSSQAALAAAAAPLARVLGQLFVRRLVCGCEDAFFALLLWWARGIEALDVMLEQRHEIKDGAGGWVVLNRYVLRLVWLAGIGQADSEVDDGQGRVLGALRSATLRAAGLLSFLGALGTPFMYLPSLRRLECVRMRVLHEVRPNRWEKVGQRGKYGVGGDGDHDSDRDGLGGDTTPPLPPPGTSAVEELLLNQCPTTEYGLRPWIKACRALRRLEILDTGGEPGSGCLYPLHAVKCMLLVVDTLEVFSFEYSPGYGPLWSDPDFHPPVGWLSACQRLRKLKLGSAHKFWIENTSEGNEIRPPDSLERLVVNGCEEYVVEKFLVQNKGVWQALPIAQHGVWDKFEDSQAKMWVLVKAPKKKEQGNI